MSSIDPMLLLAGRQPRKKIVRVKQEQPDDEIVGEPEPEEDEDDDDPPPPQQASTTQPGSPPANEAKPVKPSPFNSPIKRVEIPFSTSLVDRCRMVIVAHLERYPPALFGVLEPEEWSALVQRKHAASRPKQGSGGLDGTGRHAPAISDRYMEAVEDAHDHLKTPETDVLIWKDCCNARFKSVSRPKMMEEPWPVMVERLQAWGRELEQKTTATPRDVVQHLQTAPMNVALLQVTGIGKTVKKVIRIIRKDNLDDPTGCLVKLTRLLDRWKDMASKDQKQDQDWKMAEECHSWRQLYKCLFQREEDRRAAQGQRMREIRDNLNVTRPKVVKVRPAKKQHERIIGSRGPVLPAGTGPAAHTGNSKLQKLRQETAVISSRTASSKPPAQPWSAGKNNFSRAVAVAACAKRKGGSGVSSSPMIKRMRTAPPQAARRPKAGSSQSPPKRPPPGSRSTPSQSRKPGFRKG